MAVYGNVKVKVLGPYNLVPDNVETDAAGTLAKDVNDYIVSLDSTNNAILGITMTQQGSMAWVMIAGGT